MLNLNLQAINFAILTKTQLFSIATHCFKYVVIMTAD